MMFGLEISGSKHYKTICQNKKPLYFFVYFPNKNCKEQDSE